MHTDPVPPVWWQLLLRAGCLVLGLALLRDTVQGLRGRPLLVMNRGFGFSRVSGWGARLVGLLLSAAGAALFLLLAYSGLW